jgi:hypothetical protein
MPLLARGPANPSKRPASSAGGTPEEVRGIPDAAVCADLSPRWMPPAAGSVGIMRDRAQSVALVSTPSRFVAELNRMIAKVLYTDVRESGRTGCCQKIASVVAPAVESAADVRWSRSKQEGDRELGGLRYRFEVRGALIKSGVNSLWAIESGRVSHQW